MSKPLTERERVAGWWMIAGILGMTIGLAMLVGLLWPLMAFSPEHLSIHDIEGGPRDWARRS